ncbi:MAG TPA: efflux RND transporter periplasmic adaptor subunit [Steroidobacteraceae bacterium]|nr:efflux RND transporter periplasmic adaptor subunit [Steroidobacteraceae bacterium]
MNAAHPRLRRRMTIMLVCVGVLLGSLVGFHLVINHFIREALSKNATPTETVSAMRADYSEWQPQIEAVGTLRAVRGVNVTTELAGMVRHLHFHSGEDVKAGQALVELNADTDIATLRSLEAAAQLSATVLERDRKQLEAQAISQAQLDADEADLKNRRAQADAQRATVAKRTLRAPFAGRLGITTVNPGQYLNPGDKVVTLQALDPLYVDFRLPQQQLARTHPGLRVSVSSDAFPGASFPGALNALDPLIDTATRNFQAEAQIDNPRHLLLPGMFVRVAVASGAPQRYLTLPQTAITYNPYGSTVFIARRQGAALLAQQVFVTLGPTRGDQVAVLRGVAAGDLVVTSGQLKLKNGTPVRVDNSVAPLDEAHPSPQEED